MNYDRFYSNDVWQALNYEAPGAWMPNVPSDCIRLSAGYPAPSLVPLENIYDAVKTLIQAERDLPFQYIGSPQVPALHRRIEQRLQDRGMSPNDQQLLVTSGACQAIDLISRVLLNRESLVVVEAPTYMEALEVFRNYTDNIVGIPVDQDGLRVDLLEAFLKHRAETAETLPTLLYTIPTFQNPTGTTLSPDRRTKLLSLADSYDFLILEDDAYGELAFANPPVPLKAMDTSGRVMHVGSLSKVIAPGLRIGWVFGPEPLVTKMSWFKKDLDAPFVQASVGTYLGQLDYEARLNILRQSYSERRNTLLDALGKHMPKDVTWYVPNGGYFVWLHSPGVDTSELLPHAMEAGVSYLPGKYFFVNPQDGREYLRLSFSYVHPELMVEGVRRLGDVL